MARFDFIQKVRCTLLVKLDFLPLVRIEITNYVQELLLLSFKSLYHGFICDFKLILLLVAHVSKPLVSAFQSLFHVLGFLQECHELGFNISEV
jgi:hypothetical protein